MWARREPFLPKSVPHNARLVVDAASRLVGNAALDCLCPAQTAAAAAQAVLAVAVAVDPSRRRLDAVYTGRADEPLPAQTDSWARVMVPINIQPPAAFVNARTSWCGRADDVQSESGRSVRSGRSATPRRPRAPTGMGRTPEAAVAAAVGTATAAVPVPVAAAAAAGLRPSCIKRDTSLRPKQQAEEAWCLDPAASAAAAVAAAAVSTATQAPQTAADRAYLEQIRWEEERQRRLAALHGQYEARDLAVAAVVAKAERDLRGRAWQLDEDGSGFQPVFRLRPERMPALVAVPIDVRVIEPKQSPSMAATAGAAAKKAVGPAAKKAMRAARPVPNSDNLAPRKFSAAPSQVDQLHDAAAAAAAMALGPPAVRKEVPATGRGGEDGAVASAATTAAPALVTARLPPGGKASAAALAAVAVKETK
ncbi:unnamed protein product, partial [Phaeothamnion confervicola]